MEQKKMTLFAVMIALTIVFALLSSFGSSVFSGNAIPVLWPSPSAHSGEPSANPSDEVLVEEYSRIRVTPDTVQSVIASMQRPVSYGQTVALTLFWGGSSQTVSISCSVDGDTAASTVARQGRIQRSILKNGRLYRWYQGEQVFYSGKINYFTDDILQQIPTYESVLSLSKEKITEAQYVSFHQTTCIYVAAQETETLKTVYWIDAIQGLLIQAEAYQNGEKIWSVLISDVQIPLAEGSAFLLPNGVDARSL